MIQLHELEHITELCVQSKIFGVCRQSIDNIINRITWKHVGGDVSVGW